MKPPRLEACYFTNARGGADFRRMAAVLEATAARHCAGWSVRVREITPAPCASSLGLASHAHNTQKLDAWARVIASSEPGDRVLLIDADTAILRPLEDVWARPFDLAYTVRPPGSPFPFNGGVIFLRVNDRTKAFMEEWRARNASLLVATDASQRHWRVKYGGINQASFGSLLEEGAAGALMLERLSCAEWNCEDQTWDAYDPEVTRVLHLKGALRRALFLRGQGPPTPAVSRLVTFWRELEAGLAPAR